MSEDAGEASRLAPAIDRLLHDEEMRHRTTYLEGEMFAQIKASLEV